MHLQCPGIAWYVLPYRTCLLVATRPINAKTQLKHTERETQHCNIVRPTTVCDPYQSSRKCSLVPVSTSYINSYSILFHEGSPPQFTCRSGTGAPEDNLFFISPTTLPPRTSAIQQQSCGSQEIQLSTWLRIASLHLAEPLRPTALPHGSVLDPRSRASCCCACGLA